MSAANFYVKTGLLWNVDAAGDIGSALDHRPNNIYAASNISAPSMNATSSMTIASLSGILKAAAGLVSGSATTTDLPEGSNLYYTVARVQSVGDVRYLKLDGTNTIAANINWGGFKITNLADPVAPQDAATKAYVDSASNEFLTNDKIWIGNASNVATEHSVSGDATLSNTGVLTISAGAIDNSKVSNTAAIAYSKLNLSASILSSDLAASLQNSYFLRIDGSNSPSANINWAGFQLNNVALVANTATIGSLSGVLKAAAGVVSGNAAFSDVAGLLDLTTQVANVLPVINGGTNKSSWTAGSVIFAGAGGTSLAEDNANLFYDDAANRMFVGGNFGTGVLNASSLGADLALNVYSIGSNNAVGIQNQSGYSLQMTNAANSALAGASIGGAFSRGTLAARTQSLAGDMIFSISGQGYTGSAFGPGFTNGISFVLSENTTASANGGEITLNTTQNGTLFPQERVRIRNSGLVEILSLTPSRAVVSDASKNLVSSATSDVQIGYLSTLSSDAQAQLDNRLKRDGTNSPSANINWGGFQINNLANPTSPQDATTKIYVDNLAQGLSWKQVVRVASIADLSLASMPASIQGVSLVSGDRFLAKDQAAPAENGIYIFNGAAAAATRSLDADTALELTWATVEIGADDPTMAGAIYRESDDISVLGTDPVAFVQVSQGMSLVFTSGVQLIGNIVTAHVDNSTIDVNGSNQLRVKPLGITNNEVSASAAIAYSKLALTNSIVNADVNAAAAIAYSKLNLTASIVNADIAAGAAIAYSKLALANSILSSDISWPLLAPDSAVGAPNYSFGGDATTGMYQPAPGEIDWSLSGVQSLSLYKNTVGGNTFYELAMPQNLSGFAAGVPDLAHNNGSAFQCIMVDPNPVGSGTVTTVANLHARVYTNSIRSFSLDMNKARGTLATPLVVATNDAAFFIKVRAHGGTSFVLTGLQSYVVTDPTPSQTAMGGKWEWATTRNGTNSNRPTLRLDDAGQLILLDSTTPNLLWNTDAVGDIGALTINRPNNVYAANSMNVGSGSVTADATGHVYASSAVVIGAPDTVPAGPPFNGGLLVNANNYNGITVNSSGATSFAINLNTTNADRSFVPSGIFEGGTGEAIWGMFSPSGNMLEIETGPSSVEGPGRHTFIQNGGAVNFLTFDEASGGTIITNTLVLSTDVVPSGASLWVKDGTLNLSNLTPNTALISDANDNVISSTVTTTQLQYLASLVAPLDGTFLRIDGTNSMNSGASIKWAADNAAGSNIGDAAHAARPKNAYIGTLLEVPLVQGGSAAAGNLILSSTSNASKAAIVISDGSAFINDGDPANSMLSLESYFIGSGNVAGTVTVNDNNSYGNHIMLGSSGSGPYMESNAGGGTFVAPTVLNANNVLNFWRFFGYSDQTATANYMDGQARVADFTVRVGASALSSTNHGARFVFSSAQLNTVLQKNRLILDETGQAILGDSTLSSGINLKWNVDGSGSIGLIGGLNRPLDIYASHIVSAGDSYGNNISTGSATLLANGNSWLILTFANQTNYSYIRANAADVTQFGNTTSGVTHQIDQNGTFRMMLASGANLLWNTDGAGDIGDATHRPNNIYVKSKVFVGTELLGGAGALDSGSAQTTSAAPVTIYTLPLVNNSSYIVTAMIVGRRTDSADRVAIQKIVGAYNEGGSCAIDSPPGQDSTLFEAGQMGWDASFSIVGSNLILQVTGASGASIDWKVSISYQVVS